MKILIGLLMSLALFPASTVYAANESDERPVVDLGSLFNFANSEYSCGSVSVIDAQDYRFDVIPVKKGDQKEISST